METEMDGEYFIALGFLSYVRKIVEGRAKVEKNENMLDSAFGHYEIKGLENITDSELVDTLVTILKEIKNRDY